MAFPSGNDKAMLKGIASSRSQELPPSLPPTNSAHHERVLVLFVLKEIVDSVLFHEAGNEIEVCFTILNAIFTLLEIALQGITEIAKTTILEDLGNDVRDGHILEDAAVGSPSEKPEPRHNFGMVVSEALIHSGLREAADVSIEIALTSIGELNGYGDLLPDDFGEIDGSVFREQFRRNPEEPRDGLLSGEPMEQKNVLAQGSVDSNDSVVTRVAGNLPTAGKRLRAMFSWQSRGKNN